MNTVKLRIWLSNRKVKICSFLVIILILLSFYSFYKINQFFETHKFVFQSPIEVHMHKPIYITARVIQIVQIAQAADEHVNPLTPDQQYACDKFGPDCNVAIAIMRAESHYRANAINKNKDGSWDFGCFQINSIHLGQIDTSKYNLLNCKDNTDLAYNIYKQQKGFGAWVAYTSGVYKNFLLK